MKTSLLLLVQIITLIAAVGGISGVSGAANLNVGLARIVGGEDVPIKSYPYQISLRAKKCTACPFDHVCGGSLIHSNNVAVTAAHCVDKIPKKNLVVVAGTDNRNGSDGSIALLESIIIHENFNRSTWNYDIAILILSTGLPLEDAPIKAIEVASEEPNTNASATVTGWGLTAENGMPSQQLQKIEFQILDITDCRRAYSDRMDESMLCAGTVNGGKDACNYDSGGPLVVQQKLVGLVSWSLGCARPNYPGVYTNVAYFKNWLADTIEQNIPTTTM